MNHQPSTKRDPRIARSSLRIEDREDRAGLVDDCGPRPDGVARGVGVEDRDLRSDAPRMGEIVRIHSSDEVGARSAGDLVEARPEMPAWALGNHDHPRVAEAARDGQRSVCRSIVDEEELEVGERLIEDRLNRRREVALLVVERDRDRDPRRRGGRAQDGSPATRAAYAATAVREYRSAARGESHSASE